MIPNFRAFNKETKKMYGVDGFELSVRKIYRCSLADDEFRCGRLETFILSRITLTIISSCNQQECLTKTVLRFLMVI